MERPSLRLSVAGTLTLAVAVAAATLAAATPAGSHPGGYAASRQPSYRSSLTPADIAWLSTGANQRAIVVLRDQHLDVAAARPTRQAREDTDQAPVRAELAALHAPGVRGLHSINAVAATISAAERQRLAADPAVQAVLPDLAIPVPASHSTATGTRVAAAGRSSAAASAPSAAGAGAAQQLCPGNPAVPLLEPEALQLMNVEFGAGSTLPAARDIVDGTGVKVAWLADGLDINNPDFQRGGHSIFSDYQDYTAEGTAAPTPGGEAFGDASSIAAQGNQVYDLSTYVNPAHPLPPGCTIRIKGVAPGVSLVGLKIFGSHTIPYTSYFLQALDRAVNVDKVDVINESFGANLYPDPANDPIALANTAATLAGVTVVASTGDAGTANTVGTPADAAGVIGVGASTSFRLYRQTSSFGTQIVPGGWVDNNISGLSSAGFTQFGPHTQDVVAPGDLGWAVCTANRALYADCVNNAGAPSNLQTFGGTSESSPLTAGTAALVIEAYEHTHGGARPSPALVKRIIMSSATDLHVPAEEQGAGLVNALKAVQLAESVPGSGHTGGAVGRSLLVDKTRLSDTGVAGSTHPFRIEVTNTATSPQTVTPVAKDLAPGVLSADAGALTSTPATDPKFVDGNGITSSYVLHNFQVHSGADRLDASVTWNGAAQPNSRVRATFFDPLGRVAAYTLPQGPGGFNHVDVHDPMPGTWTALFWTRDNATVYTGPFQFALTTRRFQPVGSVWPASRSLAPGATGSFRVSIRQPDQPGDLGARLVLSTGHADDGSIPITVRSLVRLGAGGGSFHGTLTGGNGRPAFGTDNLTYQFDVPAGKKALDLAIQLRDPGYNLTGVLADPRREPLDVQSTAPITTGGPVAFANTMQFYQRTPRPGRWTLVLALNPPQDGQALTEPLAGTISFGPLPVTAAGLPQSPATVLAAGHPVLAHVHVTNTGVSTKAFFADPRLVRRGPLQLLGLNPTHVQLPQNFGDPQPAFAVPTNSDALVVVASASVPVQMDINADFGSPDIEGVSLPNASVVVHAAPEVGPGPWFAGVTEVGPFGPGAAPPATADVAAAVDANLFDPAVTSTSGDFWLGSVVAAAPFSPLVLAPGQSGTIDVTITPTGPRDSVVRGFIGLDTFDPNTFAGDEVVNLPYAYEIG